MAGLGTTIRGTARPAGRPRKFAEPSRVVTVTLPESTLAKLGAIDADRARAIAHVTELATAGSPGDDTLVEVNKVTPTLGMLTVPYSRHLAAIPGLNLVQVVPSRYLIVITAGSPLSLIELTIADTLDGLAAEEGRDREILTRVLDHLRAFRRLRRTSTAEVILLELA